MVFNSLTFMVFFALVLALHSLPLGWTTKKINPARLLEGRLALNTAPTPCLHAGATLAFLWADAERVACRTNAAMY